MRLEPIPEFDKNRRMRFLDGEAARRVMGRSPSSISPSPQKSGSILLMKKLILLMTLFISSLASAQESEDVNFKPIKNGFAFDVDGARFTLPKRIEIIKNGAILFSDKDASMWNSETDGVGYFKFEKAIFLIVSNWDTGDFTSFRLFHLGGTKEQTKEYKIMSAVEDDNGSVFFKSGAKLYYWEKFFCDQKKVYVFEDKKLDFVETIFKDLKGPNCLPKDLDLARTKNGIKETSLLPK